MAIVVKRPEAPKKSATFVLQEETLNNINYISLGYKCSKSEFIEYCVKLFLEYEKRCNEDNKFEEFCKFNLSM